MKNLLIFSIFVVAGLTGCVKIDINTGKNLDDLKFSVESSVPEGSKVTNDTVVVFKIKKPLREFSLEVSNISGDIKVFKSAKNEIRAILRYRDDAQKHFTVYVYNTSYSAKILVKTKEKWRHYRNKGEIDITLFIPENLGHLTISDVNGDIVAMDPIKAGELSLSTVNGSLKGNLRAYSLEVSSVNGSVKVDFSADSADVNNVNGSIKLSLGEFERVDVNAVNGSISVSIPSDLGIKGEANTVNGGIHYSELEDLPNFEVLEKSSHSLWNFTGGNLKFRIGSWRSSLHISTVNGPIRFHLRGSMI